MPEKNQEALRGELLALRSSASLLEKRLKDTELELLEKSVELQENDAATAQTQALLESLGEESKAPETEDELADANATGAKHSTSGEEEALAVPSTASSPEDDDDGDEWLKNLSMEELEKLKELMEQSQAVEQEEMDLKSQLLAKKQELQQLVLQKKALSAGCEEEFELAMSLIECVQAAEVTRETALLSRDTTLAGEKRSKAGSASASTEEENGSPDKIDGVLTDDLLYIPKEERDTLSTIGMHLLTNEFIREEVLAPYLPSMLQHLPELAAKAPLSPEHALQVAVHDNTDLETCRLMLARLTEPEDILLAGMRKTELLAELDTSAFGSEHWVLLAEHSALHAMMVVDLIEKTMDEEEKEKLGCYDLLVEIGQAAVKHVLEGESTVAQQMQDFQDSLAGESAGSLERGGLLDLSPQELEALEKADEDKIDTPLLTKKKMNYLSKLSSPGAEASPPIAEEA
ncbi:unnamed protein product [Amoebophrya sp. A25]|nr:unnamed protein product [Amoebophrya sp. A25]|eukprot:GSA25T00007537001.1